MRLYIVEHTPLTELAKRTDSPCKGDIVAYFRDLQDIDGQAAASLRESGITCVWAEGLISHELSDEIDIFHDRYLQNWHRCDTQEGSSADDEVIPYLLGYLYPIFYHTGMIIRLGEIIRQLLDSYPDVAEILTDLEDGKSYFEVMPDKKGGLLRETILANIAEDRGVKCRQVRNNSQIPSYVIIHNDKRLLPMFWRWIGGFRWKYLFSRLKMGIISKPAEERRVYLFLNHGLYHIGKALMKNKGIKVLCDQTGYSPMPPLRADHMFVLPSFGFLREAWQLYRRAAKGWTDKFKGDFCTFNGIDYSPFLQCTRREMLREMLIPAVIIFEQTRKMLRVLKPHSVILNGEGNIPARAVIALGRHEDFKTIFVRHGFNTYNQYFYPLGYNNPHVIYTAHGTDHLVEYGTHLPEDKKPRRVLVSNPGLNEMIGLRKRYKKPTEGKGRILAMNFSAGHCQTVTRVRSYDAYTLDIFSAAKMLIEQGFSFSYRPHSCNNIDYITYILDRMGLSGKVEIDTSPSFQEAILHHDAVVLNVTSCHYQSLFAGWPTIFYEPDYVNRQFIGLPAATDIDSPIAQTADQLVTMINEALDPESTVARFPQEFATTLAPRFLGPDPMHADQRLSDFIMDEMK